MLVVTSPQCFEDTLELLVLVGHSDSRCAQVYQMVIVLFVWLYVV